jgi:3-isopropylmalate/(R)-2-methylmalate dehydratase large subunit
MGMTMTEKILAQHAGRDAVQAGDLLVAQVDLVLANDITGPPAIAEFEKIGRPVFDKDKIALVPDHFSPCKDIKSATMCKRMRDFARQHEITNYFEVGRMGIEHALLPDSGLVAPGEIIIGADSHTCTYGALNALSTGMGQTDIGAAMASGTTWFKVPATIKVELTGKLPKYVKGKDIFFISGSLFFIRDQHHNYVGCFSCISRSHNSQTCRFCLGPGFGTFIKTYDNFGAAFF